MMDFAAYVFYVNRSDLLRRAIESFHDLVDRLTVVDNSPEGVDYQTAQYCAQYYVRIWRPPVPLTYTQSMNWMLKDAREKRADFILHFHSDASSTNPAAVEELLEHVRQYRDSGRHWACAWTFYDALWAINPVAAQAVGGWDTEFTAYFSDNDMRRRLELAGWECIDTHIAGITHLGSATINSDLRLRVLTGFTFPLHEQYYILKWGGKPGKETFRTPFNLDENMSRHSA